MTRLIKPTLIAIVLSLAYLAMLPATWFDNVLQHATQGTLAMTGSSGTLWRGEGNLQALLPSGEAVTLAPAAWKVVLSELPSLRLHLIMHSVQDGKPILDLSLSPGETRIREAKLAIPASVLGVVSPTLRAAALSGNLNLQASDVRIANAKASGKAEVVWFAAASDLTRVRPLGNYHLTLDGQGTGLDIRLTTLGGSLNLSGGGRWQPGSNPDLRITAIPVEAKRQELAPMLRILGRETAPGTYQLTLDPNVGAVSG